MHAAVFSLTCLHYKDKKKIVLDLSQEIHFFLIFFDEAAKRRKRHKK